MPTETMERKPSFSIELFPEEKKEKRVPPGDIKYIGWDKDGTLFDNMREFSEIPARELKKSFGIPPRRSRIILNSGFNEGVPLKEMLREITGRKDSELVSVLRTVRSEIIKLPPVLFEDVKPVLNMLQLEGYRMFVHSRHPRYVIREQMKILGISQFFEVFVGKSFKKGEEGFRRAASAMNVSYDEFKRELVYIGDSITDAIHSKKAQVAFIGRNSFIDEAYPGSNKDLLYTEGRAHLVVDNFYGLLSQLPTLKKIKDQPSGFKI